MVPRILRPGCCRRTFPAKRGPDLGFDRAIGVGYRGQVGLGVDVQVERAEPGARHRIGTVGER
ncbi:histidinol-phosphate phosphatase domain protein [Mycobacterium kansasii]|uniref:Histidinol-phosphate phosphatase domain protein n=1 Tax=Mycobacterium kansasii TaxID=1768 RepID=A0A1V3XZT0_MYCKA|nr:histidinol-phosphate phosphatase domain protein [Mycobacterium kansasii]